MSKAVLYVEVRGSELQKQRLKWCGPQQLAGAAAMAAKRPVERAS
jgi:hypothetical protein